jgi:hypothetical protein
MVHARLMHSSATGGIYAAGNTYCSSAKAWMTVTSHLKFNGGNIDSRTTTFTGSAVGGSTLATTAAAGSGRPS